MRRPWPSFAPIALAGLCGLSLLALAGCGSSGVPNASAGSRLVVDSTVAPVTDIVRQVVGDRVTLTGLIPEGVDSHTFEPSPGTVKSLTKARVLFMDGLHLEGSTLKQADANMPHPVLHLADPAGGRGPADRGSEIVAMGDLTIAPADYAFDFTFPKEKGDPNPHLWMNPLFAKRWSEIVRDTMATRDPANAPYYRDNQSRFAAVVDRLDAAIAVAIDSVPTDQRKLLTYHDSFAYFSRRYGIPVIGAVQPSDFSEPSPKEIQALIDQVKANHVPAIFGSEVFPSTVLQQVASAAHAQYVDKIRDDELPGDPSAANHTYVGLMVDDVRTMTKALGGAPSALDAVSTGKTWLP
ncbi:MAG: manganese/iron transport system substrate-binding protein [Acidimicrobiaceae bacterium]|nr:manganese/iron transport system substrate-binding protein [Acidimicrobiaceae bacterium]